MTPREILNAEASESDVLGDEAGTLPVVGTCEEEDCRRAPGSDVCLECAVSAEEDSVFCSFLIRSRAA